MKNLILICIFVMLIYSVYGQTQGATVDEIKTGTLTTTDAGNDTAEGGNVTMMNLTTIQSTTRWQGYYGNVTGRLSLGFGNSVFYDFSSGQGAVTSVFASRNQSFNFASLAAAVANDVDTVWGFGDGADQALDIFTGNTLIQEVNAPSCELEPSGSNFNSTILNDGANVDKLSFAFGVNVQEPAVPCFDGTNCEYELMVPSNGQEVYYFFLTI